MMFSNNCSDDSFRHFPLKVGGSEDPSSGTSGDEDESDGGKDDE